MSNYLREYVDTLFYAGRNLKIWWTVLWDIEDSLSEHQMSGKVNTAQECVHVAL